MNIKRININKVDVWSKNPRAVEKEDFERLKKQIQKLGIYKPMVAYYDKDIQKYIVLGGNMRLKALRELGYKEVEISIVHPKTESEKLEYSLSDNDRVGYYQEQELTELVNINKDEIDLSLYKVDLDFKSINLDEIISKNINDKDIIEDEVPDFPKKAKTKTGNLYVLGNHRLLCGDATKKKDIDKLMNGEKADMVFTDPPYNIGFNYENYEDKKSVKDYLIFCQKWFNLIENIKKIIITPGPRNLLIWARIKDPQDIGIWIKRNSRSGASVFHFRRCEPIIFYGKFSAKRNTDLFDYSRSIDSVLRESEKEEGVENVSPAKPIKLIVDLLGTYSLGNENVLDLFGGSGSTLIACEQLNRRCYMMEVDPIYCDVIIKRWENFIQKKAKLVNNA